MKKIISLLTAVVIACGTYGGMVNAGGYDTNVKASGSYSNLYADYDTINMVSPFGGKIDFYITSTDIGLDTDCVTNIDFKLSKIGYGPVITQTYSGSFSVEAASKMSVDDLYYLNMDITADGILMHQEEIYLTKKASGELTFIKSNIYDFNVQRCSELLTDDQSLEECLMPQNDVECDDPVVIAYAQDITQGCNTDWEKSYAIYNYILENFAYDYVQLDDTYRVYQDDAKALLRRNVAICEGMANTFVALCRAAGVPAAVSFGIGDSYPTMLEDGDILTSEDPDHAWACVCLDETWYFLDPTWDCNNSFEGRSYQEGEWTAGEATWDWYLLPLEVFSMTHKITDADTIHCVEQRGACGPSARYSITRDGTCTISGSGEIDMPYGVNDFTRVVFEEGSNITTIGEECFVDCDVLVSVILPDTVTRIEKRAFNTCEDLEYIYLPEGLTYIGECAFDYCDELAYVYVPDSVTTIDPWAFDDAPRLIISIPERLRGFSEGNYVDPMSIILREAD